MSIKQKIENYDKMWFSVFVFSLISIIAVYVIDYFFSEEFSVFDSISLFLYTMVPGILVVVSIWAIKSGIPGDIPKNH
ncbi:MAG: hypothetical protein HOD60_00600 [Candidatus Nitrosopelagicus sp.]|jgi:hypothetical protein|nr:hypothetical protein [Candidatus Nitrosopelagicus sp.]